MSGGAARQARNSGPPLDNAEPARLVQPVGGRFPAFVSSVFVTLVSNRPANLFLGRSAIRLSNRLVRRRGRDLATDVGVPFLLVVQLPSWRSPRLRQDRSGRRRVACCDRVCAPSAYECASPTPNARPTSHRAAHMRLRGHRLGPGPTVDACLSRKAEPRAGRAAPPRPW